MRSLLFGDALVSLPFAVYGGAAADDPEARAGAAPRPRPSSARELGVRHLELRNRVGDRARLAAAGPLRHLPQGDSLPEVEANLLAIPRKQRAMVRKGIERGLRSEIDARRRALLRALCRQPAPPRHAAVSAALLRGPARGVRRRLRGADRARPDGRPVLGVLSFYFRDEVLPYYAGDHAAARELAANDFKYWELMRRACERGLQGVRLRPPQARHRLVRLQEELGLRAAAAALRVPALQARRDAAEQPGQPEVPEAIEVWRRLPRGLANAVGPVLARHLG